MVYMFKGGAAKGYQVHWWHRKGLASTMVKEQGLANTLVEDQGVNKYNGGGARVSKYSYLGPRG